MFDIGWSELLVILVATLVLMGPKELPTVLYHVGKWIRKIKGLGNAMKRQVGALMEEGELNQMRIDAEKEARRLEKEMAASIEPDSPQETRND